MIDDQLTVIIRFEEQPEDNNNDDDDDGDEFLNKITLGKKYKSSEEPKLVIYSFEQLIEKFCQ